MTDMTQDAVQTRIKDLDPETSAKMACALIGHSKVVSMCFGYVHCARCEAQIGDTLASIYDIADSVIVGHDCDVCRTNALMLDWRDTFLVDEGKVFPNATEEA